MRLSAYLLAVLVSSPSGMADIFFPKDFLGGKLPLIFVRETERRRSGGGITTGTTGGSIGGSSSGSSGSSTGGSTGGSTGTGTVSSAPPPPPKTGTKKLRGPAVSVSAPCNARITKDSILAANVTDCDCSSTPALTVVGAKLDLGGYIVSCSDDRPNRSTCIMVGGASSVVKSGTVTQCGRGVTLMGDGKHEVSGLSISDTLSNGIRVVTSTNGNLIKMNTITNTGDRGIEISSNDNKVRENTISSTANDGISINDASGNKIVHNIISNTGDDGIDFNDSSDSVAQLNKISETSDDGIDVDRSTKLSIGENTITNSQSDGINVLRATHLSIYGNEVSNSTSDGMELELMTDSKIVGNKVEKNGASGFRLMQGTRQNFFSNNIAVDNAGDGFMADIGARNNTFSKNQALRNGKFDLEDLNPCTATDKNVYKSNEFKTSNDACGIITGSA